MCSQSASVARSPARSLGVAQPEIRIADRGRGPRIRTSPSPPAVSAARSVPQSEHDGLDSIAEMTPAEALPIVVFGLANCGWFSRLNASIRNSVSTPPNRVFLINASMLNEPGPRIETAAVSPYVPVGSVTGAKHDVSNQRSIVGLSSLASQIWFGRLPVPVDATPWVCVTVSGRPPRQ